MKQITIILLLLSFLNVCYAQTYEDGVAAGVRDAETLKASVAQRTPAFMNYYVERRRLDPMQTGGLGAVVPTGEPCSGRGTQSNPWGCVEVVKHEYFSNAEMSIVMWSDWEVVSRTDYLYSRYNESDYWRGVYDGFLMRWWWV
jgi:hypothetical protein